MVFAVAVVVLVYDSIARTVCKSFNVLNQVPVASGRPGCFEVCYCNPTGRLSNCIQLDCVPHLPCDDKINGGKIGELLSSTVLCYFDEFQHNA